MFTKSLKLAIKNADLGGHPTMKDLRGGACILIPLDSSVLCIQVFTPSLDLNTKLLVV